MKVFILFFFIAACTLSSFSNTYTVTNTNDAGAGSLRQAIQNANIYPGSHTINFNIPASDPGYNSSTGVWKISIASSLPMITHSSVVIDGTTQTVFAGNPNQYGPEIMLDGNNNAWADYAFHIYNASNVSIKGFIIGRFVTGIQVSGVNAQSNSISGNYIGCNYNATDTMGNTFGIYILSGPRNNIIGGNSYDQRNIVSGNNHVGIRVASSNNNFIQGNFVGLNRTGDAALRNYDGISIEGTSKNNLIGGYTPAERNYVSGNVAYGIPVFGAGCNFNIIAGNYVGTDTTGSFAVPNTYGMLFDDGASYNTLGGRIPGAGNLLSGNSGYGVFIYNYGSIKDTVVGNLIGTDYTGTLAVPNANGIVVDGPSFGHTIDNNVISGNLQIGIDIHIAGSDSNVVINNKIGTDITGTLALANQIDGVRIAEGPKCNIIGLPGKGNIIANNGGNGVTVMTSADISNSVSSNSIYNNQGMGIDLFPAGPTPNDAGDTDTGPNMLINYPVISSCYNDTGLSVYIAGNLDTQNPELCTVELFSSSWNGPQQFIGSVPCNTSGNWQLAFPGFLPEGTSIVATATDINGNTSEFSPELVININNNQNSETCISVYPNPFTDFFNVSFYLGKRANVKISLISETGRTIKNLMNDVKDAGSHVSLFSPDKINGKRLPAGKYILEARIDNVTTKTIMIRLE